MENTVHSYTMAIFCMLPYIGLGCIVLKANCNGTSMSKIIIIIIIIKKKPLVVELCMQHAKHQPWYH